MRAVSTLCPNGPIRNNKSDRIRQSDVLGIVVHTTGTGVMSTALSKKENSVDTACKIYKNGDVFPGYVIGQQGEIVQIVKDSVRALHAGIAPQEREKYTNGTWKREISPDTLRLWLSRHSDDSSPLDLLPHGAHGVNDVYIGIELIQLLEPNSSGFYYTDLQMDALIELIKDIRSRHPKAVQLLGHEDINPLRRSSKSGGWDPGGMRDKPWFDWTRILVGIEDL